MTAAAPEEDIVHPVMRAALGTEHINDMLAQAAKSQRAREARTGWARMARHPGRSRAAAGSSGQIRQERPRSRPADPAAQPVACHAGASRRA